jgi:hypothetical protein
MICFVQVDFDAVLNDGHPLRQRRRQNLVTSFTQGKTGIKVLFFSFSFFEGKSNGMPASDAVTF